MCNISTDSLGDKCLQHFDYSWKGDTGFESWKSTTAWFQFVTNYKVGISKWQRGGWGSHDCMPIWRHMISLSFHFYSFVKQPRQNFTWQVCTKKWYNSTRSLYLNRKKTERLHLQTHQSPGLLLQNQPTRVVNQLHLENPLESQT